VSASFEVVEFTKKFEEFSLVACLAGIGCLGCTSTLAWFLDSGASRHVTGMRSIFLSFSEIALGRYVGQGYRSAPPTPPRNLARSGFAQEASFGVRFWISEARSGVQKCASCQSGSFAPRSSLPKSRSSLPERFNQASWEIFSNNLFIIISTYGLCSIQFSTYGLYS